MHSSRMRTARSSSRHLRPGEGVCLSECWDISPPGCEPGDPPGCGTGDLQGMLGYTPRDLLQGMLGYHPPP